MKYQTVVVCHIHTYYLYTPDLLTVEKGFHLTAVIHHRTESPLSNSSTLVVHMSLCLVVNLGTWLWIFVVELAL